MEHQILDSNLQASLNEGEVKWAGFWIRVGASLIDFLANTPLVGLNLYNLYVLKNLPLQIAITLILIAYKPFMEYQYGATLGKMAVKIKVVNSDFNRINLSQAITRYAPNLLVQVVSIYSTVLVFMHPDFANLTTMLEIGNLQNKLVPAVYNYTASFLMIIVCVVAAFTKKKQGLHDMLAGTYVTY